MRIRVAAALLLMLNMPMLGACSPEPGGASAAGPGGTSFLKADPVKPAPMEETALDLTLRDSQGRPVVGATVKLDLTMPGMSMPPNRPQMMEMGNGVYTAKVLFTMPGKWEVRAIVERGGDSESFVFALSTK
jgi:hypothetical protein